MEYLFYLTGLNKDILGSVNYDMVYKLVFEGTTDLPEKFSI